jgi:hypothetical protein
MIPLEEWKNLATATPVVAEFDHKYVMFYQFFSIHSDVLGGTIVFPIGFTCDRESVPFIRGTSIRGGYTHDLLCRKDAYKYIIMDNGKSVPKITKKLAADVYLEIMKKRYSIHIDKIKDSGLNLKPLRILLKKAELYARSYIKYDVVLMWPGYFCKYKVMATLEEIAP